MWIVCIAAISIYHCLCGCMLETLLCLLLTLLLDSYMLTSIIRLMYTCKALQNSMENTKLISYCNSFSVCT
jgi:hypothetical protein